MSAKTSLGPPDDPQEIWTGHADINRQGVELAVEMLDCLGEIACDEAGVTEGDYSSLEDWGRQGRPFRNVVAEYLQRARGSGADVEAGFCAVLSDIVALVANGEVPDVSGYAEMYGIE